MKKSILSLVILAAFASGCSQVTPEQSLKNGEAFLASKDYRAAGVEYKAALLKDPTLIDARIGLAKIAMTEQNYTVAIAELQQAQSVSELPTEAQLMLARAMHADSNPQLLKLDAQKQSEIIYYQSVFQANREQWNDVEKLVATLPASSSSFDFGTLGRLVAQVQDLTPDEILLKLPQLSTLTGQLQTETALFQAGMALRANNIDSAISALKLYHESYPKDNARTLQLAHILTLSGKQDEAKPLIQPLLKAFPQHSLLNELWSIIAYDEKDYDGARSAARLALVESPYNINARLISAYSNMMLGEHKASLDDLSFIIDSLEPEHPAYKLYIRLISESGQAEKAGEMVLGLPELSEDEVPLLSGIGLELVRQGDTATAAKLAAKASEVAGDSKAENAGLGLLQLSLNNAETGFELLESAYRGNPSSEMVGNSLATAYLSANKLDEALRLAAQWLKDGKVLEGEMLSGVVYAKQKQYAKALVHFNNVLAKDPAHFMARAGTLESLVGDNKAPEAWTTFEKWVSEPVAAKGQRADGLLRNLLTAVKYHQGDAAFALGVVKAETMLANGVMQPNDAQTRYMIAQSSYLAKRIPQAKVALDKLADTDIAKLPEYWLMRVSIAEQQQDTESAVAGYQAWQKLEPSNPMPLIGYVRLLADKGQYDEAVKQLDLGLPKITNKAPGQLIRAQLLMKQRKWGEMRRSLELLPAEFEKTPIVNAMQGVLLITEDKSKEGVTLVRPFVDETGSEDFLRWLVAGLIEAKDGEQLVEVLEAHLKREPQSALANFALGNYWAENNKNQKAIEHYIAALPRSPGNHVLLNNLAYVLMRNGEEGRALAYADKALELSPNNVSYADTKANILLNLGRSEDAAILLDSVSMAVPEAKNNAAFQETRMKARAQM